MSRPNSSEAREYHAKPYRLAGRRYRLAYLRMRAKRVRARGKEYVQYYINVPRRLADIILEGRDPLKPGESLLLTTIATPSPWFHALDWSELPYSDLPDRVRREIEVLGLHEIDKETVLIPARPEQLRELGLDPEQPLTLEDIVRAVREEIKREERAAKPAASRGA
ncbi:MAG: hypothetical protein F7C35_03730 [Desulfurococcales archaeon]|nr:hypothetical protein [Desulfurococcales archaeon]